MQGNPSVVAIPAGRANFDQENEFRRLFLDPEGRRKMLEYLLQNDPAINLAYHLVRAFEIPFADADKAAVIILSRVLRAAQEKTA